MLLPISTGTDPVTVEEAKAHLAIDTADFDLVLTKMVKAAIEAVEQHAGLTLSDTEYELQLDCWPSKDPICLPASPVSEVNSVKYLDEDGAEQTVSADDWSWHPTDDGAEVFFVSGFSAPSLYDRKRSLRVRFNAGYAASADPRLELPEKAEMAILFLVGTWFANRENVQTEQQYEVPETFRYLANQLRVFR